MRTVFISKENERVKGGPSRPGYESHESAVSRGAFTGSRTDWEAYAAAAKEAAAMTESSGETE